MVTVSVSQGCCSLQEWGLTLCSVLRKQKLRQSLLSASDPDTLGSGTPAGTRRALTSSPSLGSPPALRPPRPSPRPHPQGHHNQAPLQQPKQPPRPHPPEVGMPFLPWLLIAWLWAEQHPSTPVYSQPSSNWPSWRAARSSSCRLPCEPSRRMT